MAIYGRKLCSKEFGVWGCGGMLSSLSSEWRWIAGLSKDPKTRMLELVTSSFCYVSFSPNGNNCAFLTVSAVIDNGHLEIRSAEVDIGSVPVLQRHSMNTGNAASD